ncbi:MAG TPA: SRPBCC family protein [Patescibacteria group bacterium]|nr:SRPBCC family protein [Patescibacteria group bacterium]
MFVPIVVGLLLVLVVLGFIISRQPDEFRVTRSTVVYAQPEAPFALVNDLHRWNDWSPWAKLDPNAKNEFEGPVAGTGAAFKWSGNNKVGEGKMTITESQAPNLVRMRLEFLKPFKATNETEFTFRPETSGTLVSWSMSGKNNFMSKAMNLVMNCDKMVGGQFEKGLADMKALAEKTPA